MRYIQELPFVSESFFGTERELPFVPESTVSLSLIIRYYEESSASSEWTRFIIAAYDPATGNHRLESAIVDTEESDGDLLVSLNLRTIAGENLAWENGQDRKMEIKENAATKIL
ncbi:hypothetical protein Rs2_47066 [Raphanus sativus]|nr:hypothetical protein Rs2_47066 [Raphanus sativus]